MADPVYPFESCYPVIFTLSHEACDTCIEQATAKDSRHPPELHRRYFAGIAAFKAVEKTLSRRRAVFSG